MPTPTSKLAVNIEMAILTPGGNFMTPFFLKLPCFLHGVASDSAEVGYGISFILRLPLRTNGCMYIHLAV